MAQLKHSQNFLRDEKLVKKLIEKSSLNSGDTVLEIGSGKGIISAELAKRCKTVISVEADRNLFDNLKRQFQTQPNITLHNADFLQFVLPKSKYKVFSNIPFNLTAEIVRKIIDAPNPPLDSYLIIQREAAYKYAGAPYGKETLFSLTRKPWFAFSVIHNFRKSDFQPQPQVDSVMLRIEKLAKPLVAPKNTKMYKDFLAYGFTSVKPTLKKGLEKVFGHVQFLRLADELQFNIAAKPTDLSFRQWLGMFNYFLVGVEPARQRRVAGAALKLNKQQSTLSKVHRTRTAKGWNKAI